MSSIKPSVKKSWSKTRNAAVLALVSLNMAMLPSVAFAAVPTQIAPSTQPASGDYLSLFKGFAKDGVDVIALVLAAGALLVFGTMLVTEIAEQRKAPKFDWGRVGALFGLVSISAVGIMYFINDAIAVIT